MTEKGGNTKDKGGIVKGYDKCKRGIDKVKGYKLHPVFSCTVRTQRPKKGVTFSACSCDTTPLTFILMPIEYWC